MVVNCIACRSGMARAGSFEEQGKSADGLARVRLDLHQAELTQSFAKIGVMDPYVVVSIDGREVYKSPVARGAHKSPKWEALCIAPMPKTQCDLLVSVKSASRLGSHALCGSASLPLNVDMEGLSESEISLMRSGQTTGTVRMSLKMLLATTLLSHSRSTNFAVKTKSFGRRSSSLLFDSTVADEDTEEEIVPSADPILEEAENTVVVDDTAKAEVQVTNEIDEASLQTLMGKWTCTATTGLEEFLKQAGLGAIQRRIAMSARWPSWEFSVVDGKILFINHAQLGDLKETVVLDGSTYGHKDLQGHALTCSAKWEKTEDGGLLTIWRECEVGPFYETRRVVGDTLEFVLTKSDGKSWGRSFKRD